MTLTHSPRLSPLAVALLLLLLAPLVMALEFTAPTEGASYTADGSGSATVSFSWDPTLVPAAPSGNNTSGELTPLTVSFALSGATTTEPTEQQGTSLTLGIEPGTYTATVTDANGSDNRTFTIHPASAPQTPTQTITLVADKTAYETGTQARIRVTVVNPEPINLTVKRDGVTVDTYLMNVQQQTDFLYTVLAVGQYTVIAAGQSASASTSFAAQNTTLGVTIQAPTTGSTGRVVSYTSTVSGGTAPYSYAWVFSDSTTSVGPTADHVFGTAGLHNSTLIVQDAQNRQASATARINITERLYRVDVTVLGQGNRLLPGAVVTFTSDRGGRSATTDSFGEASFRSTSAGNYTLNVTYNDTRPSPVVTYRYSSALQVTDDQDVTVRFAVPDEADDPPASTTPASTAPPSIAQNNTTTQGNASQAAATGKVDETASAAFKAAAPSSEEQQAAAEAKAALETARSGAREQLKVLQSAVSRSDDKMRVLAVLGKQDIYNGALSSVENAQSPADIEKALRSVPKEIMVLPKDTTIAAMDSESLEEDIAAYFAARGITERKEQRKYRYSIEQALPTVTLTSKRSLVRFINQDGSIGETYTVFTRSATSEEMMTFIELIPKSLAADASMLKVDGSNEVLQADPVLRFMTNAYAYAVPGDKEDTDLPRTLPIPLELKEPTGLVGLVSFRFDLTSFDHGLLYLVLVGALLGAVVAGNMYLRRQGSQSTLPEFLKLADLTLSSVHEGNYAVAGKYGPDLKAIHATLSAEEQAQTSDVITFIKAASDLHEFRTSVQHARNTLALGDVAAVGTAYERAMLQFDALAETVRASEQARLDEMTQEVERFVTSHPSSQDAGEAADHQRSG